MPSFEKPGQDKDQQKLDEAMERLRQRIEESKDDLRPRSFETETGFSVFVAHYRDGLINVTLEKGGLTSTFSIQNEAIIIHDIVGPDGEGLPNRQSEENIRKEHTQEVRRLLEADDLAPEKQIKDQLDLDL